MNNVVSREESIRNIDSGNVPKIKLKVTNSPNKSCWYYKNIGESLFFWNEVFLMDGCESLWLVEALEYDEYNSIPIARCFINLDNTDYNIHIRKKKIIKIENSELQD